LYHLHVPSPSLRPSSFSSDAATPALHSFPTRRSSDLRERFARCGSKAAKPPGLYVTIDQSEQTALSEYPACTAQPHQPDAQTIRDRKSTRLNSSHVKISYAVFCLKKKKTNKYDSQNAH